MQQAGSEKDKKESLLNRWLNRKKQVKTEPKGVRPRPKDAKIPLSTGQQRLLFLQQLHPENPFYHYADAFKFKGKLNVDTLLKSFEIVANRHDILKTKIVIDNGRAFQQINDEPLFEVSEYDLRNIDKTQIEKVYRDLAIKEARKPLETPAGYLIRISILRLEDEEYLVILTLHHIVMDKWSMRILQDEVAKCYQKLTNNEEIIYPPLEIQYADFAYWQNQQETKAETLDYWIRKLENSTTSLDLPTDFPRPKNPTFRGAYSNQHFSREFSDKLKAFTKKTNKTLYAVMLTAYTILLQRYSGETDILIGSPFTNRDEVALENLIGFFNETLVLRADLSNDPTYIELLDQVWKTTQEAFAHKDMPFETLVKSLKADRFINYNPLFQVMFIYHEVPQPAYFGEDIEIEHEPFDFGVTKFDLTLFVAEKEDSITAIFEYSKDLFEEKTIKRIHGHLKKLLVEIIENPERKISEFSIITDQEAETFASWNETDSAQTKATSIIELFQDNVETNPQKIALSFEDKEITYAELNKQANCVANYLLSLNPDKSRPIGLLVEQSSEMMVGILGILKAGLPYLPIDSEYPKERIEYILKDSSASLILRQKHLSGVISDSLTKIQVIEDIIGSGNGDEPTLSEPIKPEDDLAYVIYTSGSTGHPKGVSITHKNLLYSTIARFDFYPDNPQSFLLLSSFSFDSSVVGIFWTLATGGKLVLTKRRAEQDLDKLAELFVKEKITHTLLLPTLYSAIINNINEENLASLTTVIVAGEICPKNLCRKHFELLPQAELYNEYGPTEATVWATAHKITPKDLESNIPIGKPIAGAKIFILDDKQKPVPIGVKGEMYIGGAGVAKEYFNNAELTAERFLTIQINDAEIKRLYRTGDMCRYNRDGVIEFLGRKDNQVKLRGYRIELDEIQTAIKQNEAIKDVIVKLENPATATDKPTDNDSDKTQRLIAYYISDKNLSRTDLTKYLSDKLPKYMIPAMFVQVEDFPKLPNGKIDIKSLTFVEDESKTSDSNFVAPTNEIEKQLVKIWEEVLNVGEIGINDNFFEIGGDSILSIQIISKARKEGIVFSPNQLFEQQTIAELALFAKSETKTNEPETITGEIPLLPIQKWFFDEHKNVPNHWNQAFLIDISDSISGEMIKKAINKIVEYHDALRLGFEYVDENWKASIAPPVDIDTFAEIDLTHLSSSEINSAIKIKSGELQSNLNLAESSLFRAVFFKCGQDQQKNRLLLFAHHLLIDHISWQILFSDLNLALQQIFAGQEISFASKTTSYKKWSELLVDFSKSGKFDGEVEFWKKQFTSENIPIDFDAELPVLENSIEHIELELDRSVTKNFLQGSNETYNTKPFELLMTAFMQAYAKWSDQKKLCIGLESHGRQFAENGFDLSNTVGWFTNYYPVLLKIENIEELRSNVISVKETLRTIPNNGIGFGVLRYHKMIEELMHQPQVIFNYLGNQKASDFEYIGKREFLIEGARSENSDRHHILEINALVENEKLTARISFSRNLHRLNSIEKLSKHFENELINLIDHCLKKEETEYSPSDFPEAELNQDDLNTLLDQF